MVKELIVSSTSLETRLAILEDDQVAEILIERKKNKGILGNIYKGRVTKVLPGMQAAFVDIGMERHGFLYVGDFFEDYEEYEELFNHGRDEVQPLVKVDRLEGEELRRDRRGKARPRGTPKQGQGKTPARSSEAAPTNKKRKTGTSVSPPVGTISRKSLAGPVEAPSEGPEEQDLILPQQLELKDSPAAEFSSAEPKQTGGDELSLLPDPLEASDTGEEKPLNALPDDEASLSQKPDLHRLSARTVSRRRGDNRENGPVLIGDVLREGQEILVQVAKEPIGSKGARVTSHVALPGRHLVFMPTVDHVGVSRRICDEKERSRLRDLVLKLRGDFGKGFIVRTVGEGRSEKDLSKDMAYLTRLWEGVRARAERRSAPALIHAEPSLILRVVRDHFSDEFRAIRVDDEHAYERIVDFVHTFNPKLVSRIRLYNKSIPIFDEFGISEEIEKALKHKAWLKNGGYIVINQTEALVAIDVNTGKFVGKSNSLEETITKTNLGAVREVVRQIRLRDLGGILIIDFIDMDDPKNRQKVLEALHQELAKDKSPSKILGFNEFGLVAITRKRVKQSLERALCQPCIFCSGTGMTKSVRTVAYSIHQEVRKMIPFLGGNGELLIRCHPDVAKAFRDSEKGVVQEIEEMTGEAVSVMADPLMHVEQFNLVET
ncbi:MAG: ribonuclease E/G [Acidobacteriota bacterium]